MVEFTTIILKFEAQGEKTGWTYIDIPQDVAQQLKPDFKKSFRVKGTLDSFAFRGIALTPMGEGNFILALKADIRKGIRKSEGAMLLVRIEEDKDFKIDIPEDLLICFGEEPEALDRFQSLARGHRDYFIKWINEAKTQPTRDKRMVNTVNAMVAKINYGEMIRHMKAMR